jgi:hypothetical protein
MTSGLIAGESSLENEGRVVASLTPRQGGEGSRVRGEMRYRRVGGEEVLGNADSANPQTRFLAEQRD